MAIRQVQSNPISLEEFEARSNIAKALWIVDQGDSRSTDPKILQAQFDTVKTEYIGKATKIKKTLENLGYIVRTK